MTNIYDPVSPTDTYVIYDQFHLKSEDHFEESVKGWESAVYRYNFFKTFYPNICLGLCTKEYYDSKIKDLL